MKIFATVFPFVEPSEHSGRMGRYVANYEFLKALVNYSHFDKFHLFCLNPSHIQATIDTLVNDPSVSDEAKAKIDVMLFTQLTDMLKSTEYHCCHLGGWGYFFSGMSQLRNQHALKPFPITGVIHSLNARDTSFDIYKLLKSPIQNYDSIICTSEPGREVMRKKLQRAANLDNQDGFPGQLSKIPLGIDDSFDQLPSKAESRQQLGLGNENVLILYIGRISPTTKADLYPLLITIKQLAADTESKFELLIAGGANQQELTMHQDMINELGLAQIVHLVANFDPQFKQQLYCAADICVAPSDNIQETFGISIIEAMACGLPVVAADINGYSELIEHGVNGYKVTTTWLDEFELAELDEIMSPDTLQTLLAQAMAIDLEQLHNHLKTLIESPSLRDTLGSNGKSIASNQYRWQTVIHSYETLWDELKAQALAQGGIETKPNLFSNDYLNSFSHYPTQQLGLEQKVSITALGYKALEDKKLPSHYTECAMILDQEWLSNACIHIHTQGTSSVGQLLEELGDQWNKGRFTLLWAAKYGLLKIAN